MKRTLARIALVGVVTAMAQLTGCDNDPDPCMRKKMVGGSFTMGERITNYGGVDTLIVSDTVITENFVVFKADSDYVSYEWKIGDDPRTFDTKEVTLRFMQPETTVPIRLIAKWAPDKQCFPEDDGVDTVYRYLTVVDKKLNPIFGKYRGALVSNPQNVYTIEIIKDEFFETTILLNINEGCEATSININTRFGYKIMNLSQSEGTGFYLGSCKNPKGWFVLNQTNTELIGMYSFGNGYYDINDPNFIPETQRFEVKFVGKKQ
ncbi:MAG: hypothetical protein ACOYXA_08160 [Bacteroidota bacterium]